MFNFRVRALSVMLLLLQHAPCRDFRVPDLKPFSDKKINKEQKKTRTDRPEELFLDPTRGRRNAANCQVFTLPPPVQPFRVIWNHPDACKNGGSDLLNLRQWKIIHNSNRNYFGDEIQTLNSSGKWPSIDDQGTFHHGGLPQLFSETQFSETRSAFQTTRVDKFKGLAVIDWQKWHANFNHNTGQSFSRYQDQSRRVVRERQPSWDAVRVNSTAFYEWGDGVKSIMLAKLRVGREVMPHGYWGFYNYPQRFTASKQNDAAGNNGTDWLWRNVTGLFPSIQLRNPSLPRDQKIAVVRKEMEEAVRIQNAFCHPNTPVYAYSAVQEGSYAFFDQNHLNISIGLVARMGGSGVVLWGRDVWYTPSDQCDRLKDHLDSVLGPYVQSLVNFLDSCSTQLCNGHGRCVHNAEDTLIAQQAAVSLSRQCTTNRSQYADYHCRCYAFWEAPCCRKNPCAKDDDEFVPNFDIKLNGVAPESKIGAKGILVVAVLGCAVFLALFGLFGHFCRSSKYETFDPIAAMRGVSRPTNRRRSSAHRSRSVDKGRRSQSQNPRKGSGLLSRSQDHKRSRSVDAGGSRDNRRVSLRQRGGSLTKDPRRFSETRRFSRSPGGSDPRVSETRRFSRSPRGSDPRVSDPRGFYPKRDSDPKGLISRDPLGDRKTSAAVDPHHGMGPNVISQSLLLSNSRYVTPLPDKPKRSRSPEPSTEVPSKGQTGHITITLRGLGPKKPQLEDSSSGSNIETSQSTGKTSDELTTGDSRTDA